MRMARVLMSLSVSLLLCAGVLLAQHAMAGGSDDQIVASAMKAAPAAVAKNATVIDVGADGKVRTVRQGSNGFTCMGDNPATPGRTRCAATPTPWSG